MTAAATGYSRTWRRSSASRFIVLVVLLAFALQSVLTQTHIHGASQSPGGFAKVAALHVPGQTPRDNSQENCPLCQAVVQSGVFVASATPFLSLPFAWVETVALIFSPRASSHAAAHDWRSRAPPQL
jgi:hypothetical protein